MELQSDPAEAPCDVHVSTHDQPMSNQHAYISNIVKLIIRHWPPAASIPPVNHQVPEGASSLCSPALSDTEDSTWSKHLARNSTCWRTPRNQVETCNTCLIWQAVSSVPLDISYTTSRCASNDESPVLSCRPRLRSSSEIAKKFLAKTWPLSC